LGPSWLSQVLLAIASAGLVVLIVALAIQLMFGKVARLAFMEPLSRFMLWVAVAAWVVVAAAFVARLLHERVSWR
jgi:hypothetical protein